jgi:hypothetical protein
MKVEHVSKLETTHMRMIRDRVPTAQLRARVGVMYKGEID